MTKQVQFRKGTTAEHFNFTGALAEITVDTDKNTAVVHDGSTPGGFELARARWTFVSGNYTLATNQKVYSRFTKQSLWIRFNYANSSCGW